MSKRNQARVLGGIACRLDTCQNFIKDAIEEIFIDDCAKPGQNEFLVQSADPWEHTLYNVNARPTCLEVYSTCYDSALIV